MAISLRLDNRLEQALSRYARDRGRSKSEIIRGIIADFVRKKEASQTAYDLGKELFGRKGSGKGNLSSDRKSILKEKLHAKKSGC